MDGDVRHGTVERTDAEPSDPFGDAEWVEIGAAGHDGLSDLPDAEDAQPDCERSEQERAERLISQGPQCTGLVGLEVSGLGAFEKHLFGYLDSSKRELLSDIAERKVLDEDLTARLEAAIREAKEGFAQAKGAA
jgi:hypothetical protein